MPNDLQTTQGKEDANAVEAATVADKAKRDAEDDDVDTEVSLGELEQEVEENNRRGTDKARTRKKVKRSQKKTKQAGKYTDQK